MFKTFNMGVGYIVVAPQADVPAALDLCRKAGYEGREIGTIEEGTAPVEITGIGPNPEINDT